jgi:hypothetical protein
MNPSPKHICTNCGSVETPRTKTPGSLWIEVLLWFFFILPGLLYSLSRINNRGLECGVCGKETIIPINSPKGRKMLKKFDKEIKDIEKESDAEKIGSSTSLAKKLIYIVLSLVILYILYMYFAYRF